MYCPKCSQQQASDEMRFCSRCGFQLGVVKVLLADDEGASATAEAETQTPRRPLRKRDVITGATLMFAVTLLLLLLVPAIPPVRNQQVFFLLVLWIALNLFIGFINPVVVAVDKLFSEKDASPSKKRSSQSQVASRLISQVNTPAHNSALPPSQSIPVEAFGTQRVNTAEMAQPPSITERTTNLLDTKVDPQHRR